MSPEGYDLFENFYNSIEDRMENISAHNGWEKVDIDWFKSENEYQLENIGNHDIGKLSQWVNQSSG